MKYLFVVNPSAGKRKAEQLKQTIIGKLSSNKKFKDYKVIIPFSTIELDKKLHFEIERRNYSVIVAVGGDGTIATIIQTIFNYPYIQLGIIPQGTGNILASNLGISNNIDLALETIFHGNEKLIDLGQVNKKPFTIMAGTGLPSEIIEHLKKEEKELFGVWAYFLKGLEHLYNAKEFSFEINIDGKEIKKQSIGVFISNAGNFLGPLPTITPQAEPTDGYLDVFIVSLKSLRENPVEYFELFINYFTRNLKQEDKLQIYKAKNIVINSIPKLKVQADGDIVSETPCKIRIIPKRLKVLVPKQPVSLMPNIEDIIQKIEGIFKIKISI